MSGPPRAWPRIHERWREERDFNFEGAYRHELGAFGEMLIRLHLQSAERQARILAGEETYDLDAFMPSNATSLVLAIHHRLREAGVAEEELWQQTVEFFLSDSFDSVPYMRISSLLFAALARKAAISRQMRPPNRGTISDVTTVAAVLPTAMRSGSTTRSPGCFARSRCEPGSTMGRGSSRGIRGSSSSTTSTSCRRPSPTSTSTSFETSTERAI